MIGKLFLGGWLALVAATSVFAQSYESLKAEAEKFYAEKSFAKAHELYVRAAEMSNISSNEARWVFFRKADTLWRSQFATETSDTTKIDQARGWLEQALRETQRVEDRDQMWAEVQESLADFFWTRRHNNNWGEAWPHYQQALDWWAGARDIEAARGRYLAMVTFFLTGCSSRRETETKMGQVATPLMGDVCVPAPTETNLPVLMGKIAPPQTAAPVPTAPNEKK